MIWPFQRVATGWRLWEWSTGTLKATFAAGNDVAYDVAWKGEGTELVVGCGDRTVRVMEMGAPVPTTLRVHSAAVLAVAWLKEEDLILSASADQTIRVLNGTDGKTVRSLDNHTAAVRDLAVRPGAHPGSAVAASAGADRTVRFWQPAIGRLVRFARLPVAPTAIFWAEGGTHVLAACEDGRARAIDYETLAITELPEGVEGCAHAIVALPGGESAVLAGEQGRLRIVPLNAINR